MNPADLYDVGKEALVLALLLSLPVIAAALVAGVVTGLFQAYTKMSEPAINHAARIAAVFVVALMLVTWVADHVSSFAERVFSLIHVVGV
ncbi:MAG: flagellar biosynthetic protein FliQ [Deltaproteobacteria bacterium]|nr:flagellar biosynthetic protein FliQ [Deltaproteobacteria bacterium]